VVGKAGGNRSTKKCQDAECGTDSHHKPHSKQNRSIGIIQSDHPIGSSNQHE
jgi:hypothetical protein